MSKKSKSLKVPIIYLFLLLFICTFIPTSANAASENFVGEGTETNPYLISTADDLKLLGSLVNAGDTSYNNKYYKLENDIDLSSIENFSPIGLNESYPFYGTFNGDGHKIKNMTIKYTGTTSTKKNFGLFGYNVGNIKNIPSIDGVISIDGSSYLSNTGGIVGYNKGLISYCNNNVSITSVTSSGGIAGINYGIISNSSNYSNVKSTSNYSSGIAGYNWSKITNCYNTGTISGANSGGIAGNNYKDINNSYNTGMISGDDSGGIAASSSGKIYDCYNIGSIFGDYSSGGIAGSIKGIGSVSTCYNIGFVSGNAHGGIVGTSEGIVSNSYYLDIIKHGIGKGSGSAVAFTTNDMQKVTFTNFNFNDIWDMPSGNNYPLPQLRTTPMIDIIENTKDYSEGRGTVYDPFVVSTKIQLDNVRKNPGAFYMLKNDIVFNESDFSTGGLFFNEGLGWKPIDNFMGVFDGNNYKINGIRIWKDNTPTTETGRIGLFSTNNGIIKNLKILDGKLELSGNTKPNAGLIAGENYYGTILNCSVDGIISSVTSEVGGITGSNNRGVIEYCTNNADIKYYSFSNYISGGIAGSNLGRISYSSNNGNISGHNSSGGISGENFGTINMCHNTGNISSYNDRGKAGGITGELYNGVISDCFNTGQVTPNGWGSNVGGISGSGGSGTIKNTYNIGLVSGSGISGTVPAVLENCYYSNASSNGIGSGVDNAIACTLEQLQQQSTFTGFNFNEIWGIIPESSYKYPQLVSVPIVTYTVTYNSQGGSTVTPISVTPNSRIIEPNVPSRFGYIFEGWYKGPDFTELWQFNFDKVTSNMTLYAKWFDNRESICDVNRDGVVDMLDLVYVATWYNSKSTDEIWHSKLDLNNDGIVDIYDLVICAKKIEMN